MLEAVFSGGRGPSETSHHSLFKYAVVLSPGENSPVNRHLAPGMTRFGPVAVRCHVCVFLVAIDPMDRDCCSFVGGEESQEGREE